MANLTDGDLVSLEMVLRNECVEPLDQFRLVATEFELRTGANVIIQAFDKQLQLGDEKGGNDAPSDGLLYPARQDDGTHKVGVRGEEHEAG